MDKETLVKNIIEEQEELEEPNEERLLPIGGGSESRRGRHKSGKHQHMSLLDRVWQVLGTTEDQVINFQVSHNVSAHSTRMIVCHLLVEKSQVRAK